MERSSLPIIAEFIALLAERADTFSAMAGVGGMETAGHLISYLDENPNDLEPWLNGGFSELPEDWITRGSLTYFAGNGKVTHPRKARYAKIVKGLR